MGDSKAVATAILAGPTFLFKLWKNSEMAQEVQKKLFGGREISFVLYAAAAATVTLLALGITMGEGMAKRDNTQAHPDVLSR